MELEAEREAHAGGGAAAAAAGEAAAAQGDAAAAVEATQGECRFNLL